MIPVALSIGDPIAAALAVMTMIGLNLYQDHYGDVIYTVVNPYYGNTDSIQVPLTHKPKGNYFCPVYCKVKHAHQAHLKGYQCGVDNCGHFYYEEPQEGTPYINVAKRNRKNAKRTRRK
tara:strand:+ start:869 stop:1225 length:357 start_codon:yes stop_codon:yes gene_type:complete